MTEPDAIRLLWDYLRLGEAPAPADILFVLGNADLRCAERAAALWRDGYAPLLVISGASGRSTAGVFSKNEAELFADVAHAHGVPYEAMILEKNATNTGENVRFTKALLAERGLFPKTVLAVQKPYAERRTYASLAHHWPEVAVRVTSQPVDFENYCNATFTAEDTVQMMVGEVQRMVEYPKRGWQLPQPAPAEVLAAFRLLANSGDDRELLRGVPRP